jgi:hypothetical protein
MTPKVISLIGRRDLVDARRGKEQADKVRHGRTVLEAMPKFARIR